MSECKMHLLQLK